MLINFKGWENKESITDGGWKNKKSFKNKERDDNEILESKELISKSGADKCDDEFVDVNDAIMPADDNNEEKGGEDEEEYGEQEKVKRRIEDFFALIFLFFSFLNVKLRKWQLY